MRMCCTPCGCGAAIQEAAASVCGSIDCSPSFLYLNRRDLEEWCGYEVWRWPWQRVHLSHLRGGEQDRSIVQPTSPPRAAMVREQYFSTSFSVLSLRSTHRSESMGTFSSNPSQSRRLLNLTETLSIRRVKTGCRSRVCRCCSASIAALPLSYLLTDTVILVRHLRTWQIALR